MSAHCHIKRCRTAVFAVLLLLLCVKPILAAEKQLGQPTLVHFETASARLNGQEVAKLKKLAREIKREKIKMILVEGYCDRRLIVSDYEYSNNQQLSQARAYNVSTFLQNETGLPANRFTRYGYGASTMISRSGNKTGLAANRRVEVRVFLQD